MSDTEKKLSVSGPYKLAGGAMYRVATAGGVRLLVPDPERAAWNNIADAVPSYARRPNGFQDMILTGTINSEPR